MKGFLKKRCTFSRHPVDESYYMSEVEFKDQVLLAITEEQIRAAIAEMKRNGTWRTSPGVYRRLKLKLNPGPRAKSVRNHITGHGETL